MKKKTCRNKHSKSQCYHTIRRIFVVVTIWNHIRCVELSIHHRNKLFLVFYQWRVHFKNRHKLTTINHKKQESFNVAIMKYKKFFVYVQRQINRLLRFYRRFVKAYVNDIVIYSKTLKKHFIHFDKIFDMLDSNNISIKSKKTFIDYFTIHLLNQKINSLKLIIAKKKLKIIFHFFFRRHYNCWKFISISLIECVITYSCMQIYRNRYNN